ncbi:L7Ae/L30e/S12e/Gadd45 family ribosomal protein [Candidatus Zixiibacteriota bacterium]
MRMRNQFSNLLGIAFKGGNAVVGRERVREAVQRRNAVRVFVTIDAGNALVSQIVHLCRTGSTPLTRYGDKAEMGRALGRQEVAVVALTDRGLSDALMASIEEVSSVDGSRTGKSPEE